MSTTTQPDAVRVGDLEDPAALYRLATQLHLSSATQLAVAINEYGELPVNRDNSLSSAHAALLGRDDLDNYVARILLDVNNPQTFAALEANIDSPTVRWAAGISNVQRYRELVA